MLYCLMGNHWHWVVEVEAVSHLSRWMHWLCNRQVRLAQVQRANIEDLRKKVGLSEAVRIAGPFILSY
jgi:REP element-mobilizing transposase RayT